jgi:predicted RNA-binding protein with PIN domain
VIPLPEDVALALMRGLGAYLRATPPQELPANVRRFKGFRGPALAKHRDVILALLDDETDRSLIAQWIKEEKPPVAKPDLELLTIAVERADGWEEALVSRSAQVDSPVSSTAEPELARATLEREKEKARRAREDLKKARESSERAIAQERARAEAALARVNELENRIRDLEDELESARSRARSETERSQREMRRARSEIDKLKERHAGSTAQLKETKRALEEVKKELERATTPKPKRKTPPKERVLEGPRPVLPVPKGRFEDAPETLDEWLSVPDVLLVIDGYNVTKAEGGYGDLELSKQRERLVDESSKLARRKGVSGYIVFDGAVVDPGTYRGPRGPLKVVFSSPDEIADDHIVALIGSLPPVPVVLVTNDRELQSRASEHRATIARSPQLLGLLRSG